MDVLPPEFQLKQRLKEFIQNNCDKVLPYVLMGSDHAFSTDFPFVCGNGVTAITSFRNFDHRETFYAVLQYIS